MRRTQEFFQMLRRHREQEEELSLQDWLMAFVAGATSRSTSAGAVTSAGKQVGTIGDGTLAAGQNSVQLPLTLNKRGRRALGASGKLTVRVSCTLRDAAGITPFSGTLKLVQGKSKK